MKVSVSTLAAVFLGASLTQSAPIKKRDTDLDPARCPDFCAGTSATNSTDTFVCGDPRLGPVTLPAGLPLEGIAGLDSTYRRFGGLCPGEWLARYTNSEDGSFMYPPFDGYSLTTSGAPATFNLTIEPGTFLDRFGSEFGAYMSPAGAPYAQRSLPPVNLNAEPGAMYPFNYRVYTVSRSIVVEAGPIAAWFGQQGLGLQFLMPMSVGNLVDQGYLSRVNLTADPNW